jgi:hypothetical protein
MSARISAAPSLSEQVEVFEQRFSLNAKFSSPQRKHSPKKHSPKNTVCKDEVCLVVELVKGVPFRLTQFIIVVLSV